jgi:hypothetical protein
MLPHWTDMVHGTGARRRTQGKGRIQDGREARRKSDLHGSFSRRAVDRARAEQGGVLTPQGQLDAAAEVGWRTANVPVGRRDIEATRAGKLAGYTDDEELPASLRWQTDSAPLTLER